MFAEMWVVCLRSGTNHRGTNTTGHIEGYHGFVKELAKGFAALAKRLDRLIYLLTDTVQHHYISKEMQRFHGMPRDRPRIACLCHVMCVLESCRMPCVEHDNSVHSDRAGWG